MIMSGLLEGLAVTVALPLLGALGSSGSQSGFVKVIEAVPAHLGLRSGPVGVGVLMLVLIAASGVTFLAQARYTAGLQVIYATQWQTRLFAVSIRADLAYLGDQRGGDVVNALVTDVNRVAGAFYHSCIVLAAIVNLVVYLVLAMLVSPVVSVAVVGLGAVLFLATRPFLARAYGYGAAITQASADVQSLASESIAAAKLVKANAAEDVACGRFGEAAGRLAAANFANAFDIQKAKAVFEFGGAAGVAAILIVGPLLLSIDVATVLVVLALFVRLLPRVTGLQQGVQALTALLPALANLRAQLDAARAAAEPADDGPLPGNIAHHVPPIVFEGVTVVRGGRPVLRDVDLVLPAGRIVAFVGPSGSGKSTLVDAVLGLVPLARGSIRIGETPLSQIPLPAWRRSVGYVGQDTVLLGGTIAENVRFGNAASDAQVDAALAAAAAADFVAGLDRGGATPVGDRGGKLSGGERQRLGLARALAVPRLLYVLDEATSALDAETEARVIETVAALAGSATVLVVAHRFSAVRAADLIHVIEDGRIIELGTWDELDKPGRRFRVLKELQSVAAIEVG
jgi:ATP-binding cassette subfamily C protein